MAISTELTADFPTQVGGDEGRDVRGRQKLNKRVLNGLISLYRPRLGAFLVTASYALVIFLIYAGWRQRPEWPMTAESGLGYTLGIVGGVLMLLLLLYPLRKHSKFMRRLGPTRYWFRMHMLFGVLGPVCVLFHSGFQLGSLNSSIAMLCMVVVALSGLVGRYFYTRIHHGLYGRRATLQELQQHSQLIGEALREKLASTPWILERVEKFEKHVFDQPAGLIGSSWSLLSLGVRTWSLYLVFRVMSDAHSFSLNAEYRIKQKYKSHLNRHIGAHLASIRKVAEFHFYERLFSIWHVLHFPLFLMLIVSGVVHVIAVHMY